MDDIDQPAFEAICMTTADPYEVAHKSYNKIKHLKENDLHLISEDNLHLILNEFLNCFWYFIEKRLEISEIMHKIGKILCEKYECQFKFDGKNYYTDCPNILLHKDFGFSMRGTEKYICSICGQDPIECEHITNYSYNEVVCTNISGVCNICLGTFGGCIHQENEKYDNIIAKRIVSEIDLVTFDLVKNPEMVYTRITKIPYSKEYILNSLKDDYEFNQFKYGVSPLFCLHCVECKGYDPKKNDNLFNKISDEKISN